MEGSAESPRWGTGYPGTRAPRLRFELVPPMAALVIAIIEVWEASFPHVDDVRLLLFAILVGLPFSGIWLILVLDRLAWWRVVGRTRLIVLILVFPVIAGVTTLIVGPEVPLRVRLEASEPALRALATTEEPQSRAGWYDITDFTRTDFGFEVTTQSAFDGDYCGFAFSPDSAPDSAYEPLAYEHLEGPWYTWCAAFGPFSAGPPGLAYGSR